MMPGFQFREGRPCGFKLKQS